MKNFLNHLAANAFLLLLPLFFVVHGYTENRPAVPLADALLLLLQYLLAAVLLFLLFRLIFRSWKKAAIFSFSLLSFQIFFGSAHDFLKDSLHAGLFSRYIFILPFSLLFFIWLFVYLKKTKSSFRRFSTYITLLFCIFIGIDIVQLVTQPVRPLSNTRPAGFVPSEKRIKPDIYLIVADSYAGKKELADIMDFDNSPFEQALVQRGFHVVPGAKSNYNSTPFSIASTLKMDYLPPVTKNYTQLELDSCYAAINRNTATAFLKSEGYEVNNLSIFSLDNQAPQRMQKLLVTGIRKITTQTFLSRVNRDIAFNLVTKLNIGFIKDRVMKVDLHNNEFFISGLMKATERVQDAKPQFVYAHLMMPHYPFYFDKNGRPNPLHDLIPTDDSTRRQQYTGYLQYANNRFLAIIDHFLRSSKTPPVIVLMGDHGFREFNQPVNRSYHFMTLNAVYLPGKDYSGFYEGMSNVNQFRTIFNAEFGQRLPMLKDSTIDLEN